MRFRYISLRTKLAGVFIGTVVAGTTVGTIIGSRIVTSAMIEQALKRAEHGLRTAWMIYQMRLERVQRSVHRSTLVIPQEPAKTSGETLRTLATENALDFLGVMFEPGTLVTSGQYAPSHGDFIGEICKVLPCDEQRANSVGTVVLPRSFWQTFHPDIGSQAVIRGQLGAIEVEDALTMLAVEYTPYGFVYGGIVLNQNHTLVDQAAEAVFGGETFNGRPVGSATIFLWDKRAATTVMLPDGKRADGTTASREVREAVLERGEKWLDRAFVVSDWHLSAYDPIRDFRGKVVGMLYVGVLEAAYLAVRTKMMLSFIGIAIVGLLLVFGLTLWFTRHLTRPLMEMVEASKRVAAGDLTCKVEVRSRDEIGHLAVSFNKMQEGLAKAREELEEWARTLESKVAERTEELRAMQEQMAHAERLAALGRMAAGVAHEINNPLGGVLAFAMLALEECPQDHPWRKNLEIIVNQTLRCRDIVKGLLEFSRQSEACPAPIDVSSATANALAIMEKQPAFQNIRVHKCFPEGLPKVLVDPGQWQQVVVNLVMNAVDAMGEHGELEVQTGFEQGSKKVFLSVRDSGPGIPPDVLPHIFEPFFSTKEVGKGTGLGLAIVHGIVTRSGGTIEVKTGKDGTCFVIRLPPATT